MPDNSPLPSALFPLTYTRLRFHCQAETHIRFGRLRAGSNLRGALLNVMTQAVCAGDPSDPAHVAICPVCWLVAANEHPGQERRGYTLIPPLNIPNVLEPEEHFDFWVTLFGEAYQFLPYFVLAVPAAGAVGVGPGQGKFGLRQVWAENLLSEDTPVLREGENLVHPPEQASGHADVEHLARSLAASWDDRNARIELHFHTPLRLIEDGHLLKMPDFGAFFARLLERVDRLAIQFAGGLPRPKEERQILWDAANRVRLVESQAQWVEVPSGSHRYKRTWLSGLLGAAVYTASCQDWQMLLPWLIWGQIAQVGKDTAKGNGAFSVEVRG